jgi:hypothetical protein
MLHSHIDFFNYIVNVNKVIHFTLRRSLKTSYLSHHAPDLPEEPWGLLKKSTDKKNFFSSLKKKNFKRFELN